MTVRAIPLCLLLLLSGACALPLEGANCPCAEGFVCCVAESTCVPGPEYCLADLSCDGPEAPECGTGMHCVNGPMGGQCACDEGYTGAACEACAQGFVKLDGQCVRPPACGAADAPVCGTHTHCRDGAAGAECACDEGYTGIRCDGCAGGFVARGTDCVPSLPCGRADGCQHCAHVVYCDTPASVAANRGTWCKQDACSREEALADCVNNIVPLCGAVTMEPFHMEFE
jgi:hypothetical protein